MNKSPQLFLLGILVLGLSVAQTQTIYDWKGDAPDGNWRQGAPGARWYENGTGNNLWDQPGWGILRFNNNQYTIMTNNISGTYGLPGMIFGSGASSARTIGGNTIRFYDNGGTDPFISNDSSATHVFNLNIECDGDVADPLLINLNSSGGLTFNGTINNQGSTVNVQGSTANTVIVTMNGAISGSGGLYKNNVNTTLVLAGNNTYSGQTTIEGGTISITNANSLGSGTLQIGTAAAYSRLLVNSNSSRSGTLAIKDNATNVVIEVASGVTFTNSGVLSQAGGTANNTKFGKHGAGTLILSGSGSSYAGQIQIGGGTVVFGQSGSFGNSTSTTTRGIDLGLYVDDVGSSENVALRASNNVTVSNSIYVAPNTSGGTRTIGVSGNGTNTFNNEIYLAGNLTVDAGAASSDRVNLSGALINTGGVIKNGSGTLAFSGSAANTYSGQTTINSGTLRLEKSGVNAVSGTIALNGGTLLLGAANQISDSSAVTMAGGTINTGGFADRAGKLTVSSGSSISGLVASTGAGVASASDFLFSSVDLSNYATSSGAVLDLGGGYAHGSTINFASTQASLANGWTGYSTTSLNNFQDKIAFGNTGMKAQISFNSTSGLTYVTAIPEPKVYVAAGILCALVGLTEYRRRRQLAANAV